MSTFSDKSNRLIILHHSEIALKKGNRSYFENRLRWNIQRALSDVKGIHVRIDFGRFVLSVHKDCDIDLVIDRLRQVIGLASIRLAFTGDPNPERLQEQVFELVRDKKFDSFCVATNRVDKQFPFTSTQVNQIVGARIHQALGARVDLKNAELVIKIDIVNKRVYYSVDIFPGERGLPIGSTGKVVSMLSSGIDSPVSSFRMMKRGCRTIFVHFHSYPFTEKTSLHNALELAKILNTYQNDSKIYFVPLADIQREIILAAPAKLRVVLYRRMMFRLTELVARREGARAIVTGESLGQVASQTLENIAAISEVVSMPVLRPLIGMEKEEIIEVARRIGTYDISIEPYDDCCSYLVPARPETNARLDEVHAAEEKMGDWASLIEKVLQETTVEKIQFPPR
ncbi:tRNA 4-thiouridine(8) synthase ThiI [candidate division KSB1 bacterium]|nr:tRNA 4-thiouridine(8) synthase ThiI [candidate division KSB1 bacterium]RQW06856.1 MAG: tRNA 4-thiouridine(8) synthase ThiI [candidate division KSB1 bacterium]